MTGLLTAALTETVLVVYRDLIKQKMLPPPSDLAAVAIVFGTLSLLPESAGPLPGLVGWGFVTATFLNLWDPASPIGLPQAKANQSATRAKPGYVAATNPSAPATYPTGASK